MSAYDDETYRDLFGLTQKKDRAYADKLVDALGRIDRALLPGAQTHPLLASIARGAAALDDLCVLVESGTERERLDALDALGHIFAALPEGAPAPVLARLRKQLHMCAGSGADATTTALFAKVLALGRDEALLHEQLRRLADEDPGVVAAAARLCGFGRHRPAVPLLVALVSPAHFIESRAAIWALGEIGDEAALPALTQALSNALRVVDVVIALGKIGSITSVGSITPLVLSGTPDQRDAGYRALAWILDGHRGDAAVLDELFRTLRGLIEAQLASAEPLSGSTRFHMLLCLARMGVTLDEARVRHHLRLGVDDGVAPLAQFFARRGPASR
jgi:HEAT repeat protein